MQENGTRGTAAQETPYVFHTVEKVIPGSENGKAMASQQRGRESQSQRTIDEEKKLTNKTKMGWRGNETSDGHQFRRIV